MKLPTSPEETISAVDAHSYVQRFTVSYEYPVVFTRNLFARDNLILADTLRRLEPDRRHKIAFLIDDGLRSTQAGLPGLIATYAEAHGEAMQLTAFPEFTRGGEACKNDPTLIERLQRRLVELGLDRHAFVVAIGGGAFLDLVGYVAATVHRGVRHIRMPTTVLSQDDSGVGVKNGVNAFGQKTCSAPSCPLMRC